MFCNLVLLNACKYFTLLTTLQFASVCCPRSFWIPGPSPRSMVTAHLVRPGSHPRSITSDVYSPFTRPPAIASPPRAESPPPSHRPAAMPIHPVHQGEFVKASNGESSAPSTASTGPSSPVATTSPKTEIKKKRKCKSVKRTVTSETVSPPEKKKKIISESPDSQAEGPFLRFRHNKCARGLISCHLVVTSTICMTSSSGYSPLP